MSTRAAFTRRQVVLTAAAVGGALVLGVALQRRRRRLIAGGGAPARGALNAYVRIEANERITLVMPQVEMGQGTFTSLPMLIAEELEVDLGAVSVEAAPPDPAVYGFAVDPAAPEGIEQDQSTGTSLSIIQCWTPLRQAGASARLMLIQAAAQRGEVIHAPSGRRLGYGALAAAAAALPVPAAPPLKAAKDFRLIGRATRRRDTPQKVDGSAVFGIDARPPNSRVALIALSPVEGGTIAGLALDAALAVRGVSQVVNESDAIAVVADDTWAAMQGMKALAPRWNDGANAAVQQADIVAQLEAAAHEAGAVAASKGKLEQAAARATTHVDAVYHQPFLAHATLEPMNCTVDWREGECEIWVGT